MSPRYKDLKNGSLFEYITPDKFRTVSVKMRNETPAGVSEIPVELQLKKRMRDMLSFKLPWDGVIYGYVRGKRQIEDKLGKGDIAKIYIVDWDDKFLLMFDLVGNVDYPVFFVSSEEVVELLENCWRIAEQR